MVDAYEEMEEVRNVEKEMPARGVCAWYDSRPLLNANDPRGRAESARRRRKWVCEGSGGAEVGGVEIVRLEIGGVVELVLEAAR